MMLFGIYVKLYYQDFKLGVLHGKDYNEIASAQLYVSIANHLYLVFVLTFRDFIKTKKEFGHALLSLFGVMTQIYVLTMSGSIVYEI